MTKPRRRLRRSIPTPWSTLKAALFVLTCLAYVSFSLEIADKPFVVVVKAIWYQTTRNRTTADALHVSCRISRGPPSFDEPDRAKLECCKAAHRLVEDECRQEEKGNENGNHFLSLCGGKEVLKTGQSSACASGCCQSLIARVPVATPQYSDNSITTTTFYSLILSTTPNEVTWTRDATLSKDDVRVRSLSSQNPLRWHELSDADTLHPLFSIYSGVPDSKSSSARILTASLESTLSSEGGMHRRLRSDIRLIADSSSVATSGSLTILLFVTQDVFIDMDEALECMRSTNADGLVPCRASLRLPRDGHATMDIEQPSFVSPQHIVAIDIEWEYGGGYELEEGAVLHLHVITQLHFRYPSPIRSTAGRYHSFLLPAPVFHGGVCQVVPYSLSDEHEDECFVRLSEKQTNNLPFLVQVAAGIENDYAWVTSVTFLCSLVGSAVLWREIVKASRWD